MSWQSGAGQGGGGAGAGEDSIGVVARRRFWVRPVASLALPGSGQWLSHQNRAAAYVVAEAYTLVRYFQLMHRGRSAATAFRDLAFQVARGGFAPPSAARDTAFEYFETMERYMASGQFNQSPGPALVPESDTTTYNGAVWRLARRTYWRNPDSPPDLGSPEYTSALQFYQGHAVGDGYRWSWSGAESQLEGYRATIAKSDNAFRNAQDQLGLLLANHVASAVDALISSRLAGAVRRPAALHTTLGPGRVAVDLSLGF
jgi:hypothetical protein